MYEQHAIEMHEPTTTEYDEAHVILCDQMGYNLFKVYHGILLRVKVIHYIGQVKLCHAAQRRRNVLLDMVQR